MFRRPSLDPARVAGPVTITCTKNDKAVGLAYAIASRLAGQVASALGDENDKYGGIGRNGAQKTTATHIGELLEVAEAYPPFTGNKLFNLKSDSFISSHGDVRNPRRLRSAVGDRVRVSGSADDVLNEKGRRASDVDTYEWHAIIRICRS